MVFSETIFTPKRPLETWTKTRWWGILKEKLDEVASDGNPLRTPSNIELNAVGQAVFERFSSGEMSAEDVVRELSESLKDYQVSHSKMFLSLGAAENLDI
jgi:uncharacterized protein (UPF0371 family)